MRISLESLADNVKELTRKDNAIITSELKPLSKIGYFSYVGIADAEWSMLDSQGQIGNIKTELILKMQWLEMLRSLMYYHRK